MCMCVKTLRAASTDNIEPFSSNFFISPFATQVVILANFVALALFSQISRMAPLSLQTVQPKSVKCYDSARCSFSF